MGLSADRNTPFRMGDFLVLPVAANAKIYAGALVVESATGYAAPGSTATNLKAVGRAEEPVDNTGGANGDKTVTVRKGAFKFANLAADLVGVANVLSDCYIVDDQTVAATDGGGTRSVAGKVLGVEADGVWVAVGSFNRQAAAQANVAHADAALAAGATPTKAEFDALAGLANENKSVINGLLAKLRTAGVLNA